MSNFSAISLLEDTVVLVYFGTALEGDTGVKPTWDTPITVKVDKVSMKDTIATSDHSAGQAKYPINRATKFEAEAALELKLFPGTDAAKFQAGRQLKINSLATLGANTYGDTFDGIITEVDKEYSGPSTMKVSVKPYAVAGAAPLVVAAT